jgi:hypothetical protein
MTVRPYAQAHRVFWIVDHGSSHRGAQAIHRLQHRYPTLRLIHLPLHASWLNQIEIYFAILQRKVLTPNDFTNPGEIEARILAFQAGYEQAAHPFEWKFTRDDLTRLMRKLAVQESARPAA